MPPDFLASPPELLATYVCQIFVSPDGNAIIAEVRDEQGRKHTIKGAPDSGPTLAPGVTYRFFGKWEDHPRFGRQFAFAAFVARAGHDRRGVVAYLTTVADNVGGKRAERLWEAYGPMAVITLRENPEAVAAAGIMSVEDAKEASQTLHDEGAFEDVKIGLLALFAGRGFPASKLIRACIKEWGHRAAKHVNRNPYALLVRKLPGCGWKRVDRLYLDLGKPPARLKRQALVAQAEVRNATSGDTWHQAVKIARAVESAIGKEANPRQALRLGIRAGLLVKRNDDAGATWLAEASKGKDEGAVAAAVMIENGSENGVLWPRAESLTGVSDHQREQWARATARRLGILTGTPGTGKTSTVAVAVAQIVERHGANAVAVCAPTGKAATRLTDSFRARGLSIRATTIHSLLEIGRNGHDGDGWGFARCEDYQLDQQFVIVDEASMLDTSLCASLLAACQGRDVPPSEPYVEEENVVVPARCRRCSRKVSDVDSLRIGYGPECRTRVDAKSYAPVGCISTEARRFPAEPRIEEPPLHVLLVGDPYQLPPVGHGAPLRDLIAAGVPRGHLTEIWRNEGLIVRACAAIKDGQHESSLTYDPATGKNLKHVPADSPQEQLARLLEVISAFERSRKFDPVFGVQVLVATNKSGDLAREMVNKAIQGLLNPNGARAEGNPFRVGDKIICLRNGFYPQDGGLPGDSENGLYVANGEIGQVSKVEPRVTFARFFSPDRNLRIPMGKAAEDEASGEDGGQRFDLGYAITCHKSQGSEWPCVIILADGSPGARRVCTREWLYTAISRASQLCITIGREGVLQQMSARVSLEKRKTFLVESLGRVW